MRLPVALALATLLLAGCLQSSLPTAASATRGNLRLDLTVDRSKFPAGANSTFELTVTNTGSTDVPYRYGCGNPWDHRVLQNGAAVTTGPPVFRCQAFSPQNLAPGASLHTSFAWNGTTFGSGAYHDGAGRYAFQAVFEHEDGSGGSLRSALVNLTVQVTPR